MHTIEVLESVACAEAFEHGRTLAELERERDMSETLDLLCGEEHVSRHDFNAVVSENALLRARLRLLTVDGVVSAEGQA